MSFARHLLVDGSNVLHAWPELRTLVKTDREAARARLAQRLIALHDSERIRVTIVFDGRGAELVVNRPFAHATFSVVHTPAALTADDVIEQMVAAGSAAAACIVATDDRAERVTVAASGAEVVSANDLAAWVSRVELRRDTRLASHRAVNRRNWQRQ